MKRLRAQSHRQAYDYWATFFDDPALMSNRDARQTRFKIERLVEQLPLDAGSQVLDVGPGWRARCTAPACGRFFAESRW